MRSTRAEVCTSTPFFSTQRLIIPPAPGPIMRGTIRSPISTTASFAPRAASASMMMQPMNPAPIWTIDAPGRARAAIFRASSSVQQLWMPGRSIPGMGGRSGTEPVATRSRSKGRTEPSSRETVRFATSTPVARACVRPIRSFAKWSGSFRSRVPASSIFPARR